MQSDFEEFEEDDGFYQDNYASPDHFPADIDLPPSDVEGQLVGTQPVQRLRKRPPVDFSARRSTVGSDFDYSATSFSRPMSGSTLHSGPSLKHSTTSFPRKAPSLDFSPKIPPAVIASLTITDLHHNPHYRELRQKYDELAGVLTTYLGRDLAGTRVATSNTLVPDISQGTPYFSSGTHSFKSRNSITSRRGLWRVIVGAERFGFTAAGKRLGDGPDCRNAPRERGASAHPPTTPSNNCPMGLRRL
jgi:hypothetical protein